MFVEINNTDVVLAGWIDIGVGKTGAIKASLPPLYAVVSVNKTDNAPVVTCKVEAGVTVIMIVDISMVETAVGVCCSICVFVALVLETEVGACSAVTLTDDILVAVDDIRDTVAVTKTE